MTEFQVRLKAKEQKKFEEAICWKHPDYSLAKFKGSYINREIGKEWLHWCEWYGLVTKLGMGEFDINDDRVPF